MAQKGAACIQAAVLEASEELSQRASALTSASNQMQGNLESMEQAGAKAAEDIGSFTRQAAAAIESGLPAPWALARALVLPALRPALFNLPCPVLPCL